MKITNNARLSKMKPMMVAKNHRNTTEFLLFALTAGYVANDTECNVRGTVSLDLSEKIAAGNHRTLVRAKSPYPDLDWRPFSRY